MATTAWLKTAPADASTIVNVEEIVNQRAAVFINLPRSSPNMLSEFSISRYKGEHPQNGPVREVSPVYVNSDRNPHVQTAPIG